MKPRIIWIDYRELSPDTSESDKLPSLRDCVLSEPQDHEERIVHYLENAPSYSGMGKIVGDVLNPSAKAVLVPGRKTDGLYVWPAELSYYVREYHVRLPQDLIRRMASLNWRPPTEEDINWEQLGMPPK